MSKARRRWEIVDGTGEEFSLGILFFFFLGVTLCGDSRWRQILYIARLEGRSGFSLA